MSTEFAFGAAMNHHAPVRELNITAHREPASVWDRRGWDGTPERMAITRWLIGVGGGALAVQGVRQKSLGGGILAAIGGSLAWLAVTGTELRSAQQWFAEQVERARHRDDPVHEASADSFPASDPPPWTAVVSSGVRRDARHVQ